jgi:hypothetical protein
MNNSVEAILPLITDLCNQDGNPDGSISAGCPLRRGNPKLDRCLPCRPAAAA